MTSKLTFHQVYFHYENVPIFEEFSFDVKQGEFVSLIGPSGIGKSTLFQLATGLLTPEKGEILLDGTVVHNRLGKVAYMPQQDLLLPWRTVMQNATLPLEIQGVSANVAKAKVEEQLPVFGLEKFADAYPDQLSGGMRQRVSLLRATLTGSDLILLDEPFSSLDGITRIQMQEWLLTLWRKLGCTVIMITHDLDEAILLSDRVLVVKERPIRQVHEVIVPLERSLQSRSRNLPDFIRTRERIWGLLRSLDMEENREGGLGDEDQ